jgi:hypothetical protein
MHSGRRLYVIETQARFFQGRRTGRARGRRLGRLSQHLPIQINTAEPSTLRSLDQHPNLRGLSRHAHGDAPASGVAGSSLGSWACAVIVNIFRLEARMSLCLLRLIAAKVASVVLAAPLPLFQSRRDDLKAMVNCTVPLSGWRTRFRTVISRVWDGIVDWAASARLTSSECWVSTASLPTGPKYPALVRTCGEGSRRGTSICPKLPSAGSAGGLSVSVYDAEPSACASLISPSTSLRL